MSLAKVPTLKELGKAFNTTIKTIMQEVYFIIVPVSYPGNSCPIDFPSTFASQELRNYYADWQVLSYQEQPGTFHRKDSNNQPIKAAFATLLARKK